MDKIKIKDLEVYCHHGVFKEENVLGQKFLVSAYLSTDIKHVGISDDINQSINYAEVAHFIKEYMEKHTYKLLETVVQNLSKAILQKFTLVEKVRLEIKKPWAPILLPLDTVSVEIERSWNLVYLSIGSNLGDKKENLDKAIALLKEDECTRVSKVSEYIETKPVGFVEQEDFLNAALELKTLRTPYELLELIQKIENELKRERIVHWGPRTIDLDILFYNDEIVMEPDLMIPHPEIQNRLFVLDPLFSIAPAIKHPIIGENIYQLRNRLLSQ